jgi:hypothetical protein
MERRLVQAKVLGYLDHLAVHRDDAPGWVDLGW